MSLRLALLLSCLSAVTALAETPATTEPAPATNPATNPSSDQSFDLNLRAPTESQSPAGMDEPERSFNPERGVAANDAGPKKRNNEWLFAPVPLYDPTIGAGLTLGVGYLFYTDPNDTSPVSRVMVMGGATSNGTWLAGAATAINAFDDHLRIKAGLIHASVNYDFFGVGREDEVRGSAAITQTMEGFFVQPLFQVVPHLHAGFEYLNMQTTMTARDGRSLERAFPDVTHEFSTRATALGPVIQWDDTDSQFFPTRGSFARIRLDLFDPAFGGDSSFQKITANAEQFHSLSDCQVLAFRESFESVFGDAPAYAYPTAGMSGDFRGYHAGKYRDRYLFAGQIEYRQRLNDQWGFTLFTSVGEVLPNLSSLNTSDLLPSAGAGLRFTLSKEHKINFRLDVAGGRDGLVVYFGVGEAF